MRVLDATEQSATLLEVSARDRRGLIWTVCRAVASLGFTIRSAHVSTFGDEARDVFYVNHEGQALSPEAAEDLRHLVFALLV